MKVRYQIEYGMAHSILDSRGNPTTEAEVSLKNGGVGIAACPSGASTGKHEALEFRDGGETFGGKGVSSAIKNMKKLFEKLEGEENLNQRRLDALLCRYDGTDNKSRYGANAILPISLACARAHAASLGLPLYRYIGGILSNRMPIPMMNILNGGAHAANNLDIQEFMILPIGFSTYSEALRAGCEIYHTLGAILKRGGYETGVGDEGGYAPNLKSEEEALTLIGEAITEAGYDTERVKLALDVASSEWYADDKYRLPKSGRTFFTEEWIAHLSDWCDRYPIVSIEDGLGEDDFDGWKTLTERLGHRVNLVGDDLFVTNPKRLLLGIERRAGNAILIKPNQIGTLSEVLDVVALAKEKGYKIILSHRSGETADDFIADLAVGVGAEFIKCGAPCRSERIAKYNRLSIIESELENPVYKDYPE